MNVITLNTNVNSTEFDYLDWTKSDPTEDEFKAIWNQLTEREQALVLADFERWQATNG